MVVLIMWVRIETKWNERAADGGEMRVLPEEKHVPSRSARAKTAFSCSIVPLSFETFTDYFLLDSFLDGFANGTTLFRDRCRKKCIITHSDLFLHA